MQVVRRVYRNAPAVRRRPGNEAGADETEMIRGHDEAQCTADTGGLRIVLVDG